MPVYSSPKYFIFFYIKHCIHENKTKFVINHFKKWGCKKDERKCLFPKLFFRNLFISSRYSPTCNQRTILAKILWKTTSLPSFNKGNIYLSFMKWIILFGFLYRERATILFAKVEVIKTMFPEVIKNLKWKCGYDVTHGKS